MLSPVPHLGHAKIDWSVEGPRYADKLLASLEQHLPDLRKHVVTKRWLTPDTRERPRDDLAGLPARHRPVCCPTLTGLTTEAKVTLAARVLTQEHLIYPSTLERLLAKA